MSLSRRQQLMLDQIERALLAADPRLKTLFAAFGRWAEAQPGPGGQPGPRRTGLRGPAWQLALIGAILLAAVGVLVIGIRGTSGDCPGLRSDQVIASAAVRYAGCGPGTDVWSRGAR